MAAVSTPIFAISFKNPTLPKRAPNSVPRAMVKEVYFNHDGSATKKLQVTFQIYPRFFLPFFFLIFIFSLFCVYVKMYGCCRPEWTWWQSW